MIAFICNERVYGFLEGVVDMVIDKINDNVISVAILNSKLIGANMLHAYIPFVSTLISVKRYDAIEIEKICKDFYSKYYFKIPAMPMKEILSRMQKKKMILRRKDGKLIPNFERLVEVDFENDYREGLQKYENIINRFVIFAKEKYDFNIDKELAEKCFSVFIKENCIYTFLNNENIGFLENKLSGVQLDKETYILYKYILYIYNTDYDSFKVVKSFCMGYIFANALNIDNADTYKAEFKQKNIYLDTRIYHKITWIRRGIL